MSGRTTVRPRGHLMIACHRPRRAWRPNAVGAPTGARTIWTRVEHWSSLSFMYRIGGDHSGLRKVACENCLVCTTSVTLYVRV